MVALVGPLSDLLAHVALLLVVGHVCFFWLLAASLGCVGAPFVFVHIVVVHLLLSIVVLLLSVVVLLVGLTFLLPRCKGLVCTVWMGVSLATC